MFPLPIILKLLTPKVIKGIISYVFEKNDLDHKVDDLEKRIRDLETHTHAPREFVRCEVCHQHIKEKGLK